MRDENEIYDDFDGEIDEPKHEKLVEDVLNLNKIQNLKKPSRTEPTLRISEFNLVKSVTGNKGSVHLNELTKVLKDRKKQDIVKKVRSTSTKSKTLPTPLEKPQAERIRRSVNYEKSRLQLDRWEALVTSNRAASQLTFPLGNTDKLKIEDKKAENYPSTWRLKSELQKELEKLEPKTEEYHINTENTETFPLSVEEIAERRREAAKLRAHQSYKEAKARQQNKIKSKKYHRILRREKIKQKIKEFEELQKTDPEEALKKLEDIEKTRAEERFSLRHKGTGQWAKSKQIRAKYDKETRKVLAQQLAISRDLTQKLKSVNSDSEDEIESQENLKSIKVDDSNPWVGGVKPDKEVSDFQKSYKVYWDEHNKKLQANKGVETSGTVKPIAQIEENGQTIVDKEINVAEPKKAPPKPKKKKGGNKSNKEIKKKKKGTKRQRNDSIGTTDWEVSVLNKDNNVNDIEDIFDGLEEKLSEKVKQKFKKIKGNDSSSDSSKSSQTKKKKINKKKKNIDLTMPSKSKKHVIDEQLIENPAIRSNDNENDEQIVSSDLITLKTILDTVEQERKQTESERPSDIDPNKFVQVKKTNLNTATPDIITDENEDDINQRNVILEAFEDDDIAEDFAKEKSDEVEKDTPKDIDLNLPGWGSWGGTNIKPSKRKRRRFIIKMPKKMPRRDDNKGSLIINEKAQSKVRPYMVSDIPFPFKTVKDYEASIRAPIGNTFVTETAYRKLIEPAVVTKMGSIIEPISKSVLVGTRKV